MSKMSEWFERLKAEDHDNFEEELEIMDLEDQFDNLMNKENDGEKNGLV